MADTETTGIADEWPVLPWTLVLPLETVTIAEDEVSLVGNPTCVP